MILKRRLPDAKSPRKQEGSMRLIRRPEVIVAVTIFGFVLVPRT